MNEETKDEKVKFEVGGFFMLYKNEEEQIVRQFAIDFSALNEQAEKENFSKDAYRGILHGFESAARIILNNYNLTPKKEAIDSMAESQKFTEMFEKALEEEQARQEQEQQSETNTTRTNTPIGAVE